MKKQVVKPIVSYDKELEKLLQNTGKHMQTLRKEKGYKNYEFFAYQNDIPRAQYGRYERGQDLKLSSLLKVVRGFNISLKEFFSDGFE